jgi:uncharacterized protein YjbJ (UPF0337 family)
MSLDDKISNKAEKVAGKGKQAVGEVTDDEQLQAEGRADQAKADLKDAADDVKEAVGDAAGKIKKIFKK